MIHSRTCVITVNYKGAADTAACVASLNHSTAPVSIIVVDNSPDDPELEGALAPYPDVKLIRAPENLGFGRGNNLGIEWALGNTDCEFVFILNNDATVESDTVSQLESAMDFHHDAGVVTTRIVLSEDTSKLWYGGGEVDWKRGGGKVPGVLGPADAPLAMLRRYVSFASGCAMLIRRTVLQQVDGFDPRYFMYDEDLELCLRIAALHWRIWYEPQALVSHQGQGSLRQKQGGRFMGAWAPENPNLPFYVYHIMCNRLLTMKQYAHGRNRAEFLIYFPLFVMAKALKFAQHRRWGAIGAMHEGWKAYRKEVRKAIS